ncbi:RNA polymerase sigma-28 (SigD/FliA/WhiG) subunit [Hypnocyclicus thermotrophus]|uniref:RNA polymerase sigma factor n=1 Tax=Hypnocyclicus thermotrophus TaxID=1627895 RepID=A0AA46I5J6_9FUSO|nr:FliA/WhiG family RNA polymerase sigma factor [Hypnocyclicus thermotrophus]TDT68571.1 RNA polymerase sigma-28 (SigD/FliA/WhiG) subunit [Hypnocyclicus thermotrophus]
MIDDKELWIEYKKTGNLEVREQLIIKYIPLVKYVVGKMITNLPRTVEYDDLVEYGIIGLLDAVEKYDLSKNINFKTYAVTRVRGSIYDELRSQDWVPRSVRKLAKDIEKAYIQLEKETGKEPTEEEIAVFLGIPQKKIEELYSKVDLGNISSLDDIVYDNGESKTTLVNLIEDKNVESPEEKLQKEEVKQLLIEKLKELKEKERLVLTLYYYEKLTLKEIGEILSISESRVSQIHSKAILKLRSKIATKFGNYAEFF